MTRIPITTTIAITITTTVTSVATIIRCTTLITLGTHHVLTTITARGIALGVLDITTHGTMADTMTLGTMDTVMAIILTTDTEVVITMVIIMAIITVITAIFRVIHRVAHPVFTERKPAVEAPMVCRRVEAFIPEAVAIMQVPERA